MKPRSRKCQETAFYSNQKSQVAVRLKTHCLLEAVTYILLLPQFEEVNNVTSTLWKKKLSLRKVKFSSVQSLSPVQLFAAPCTTERQASLSITNSWSPPKSMSIESVMPSSHLILCRPLLLLPSIFPSIRVFSNVSSLHIRWPKDWSFSFSISPTKEHPGLIFFRMDWLDLIAVKGTLKSLLHSSKASIIQHSAFFIVQLSHPYWKSHSFD